MSLALNNWALDVTDSVGLDQTAHSGASNILFEMSPGNEMPSPKEGKL